MKRAVVLATCMALALPVLAQERTQPDPRLVCRAITWDGTGPLYTAPLVDSEGNPYCAAGRELWVALRNPAD